VWEWTWQNYKLFWEIIKYRNLRIGIKSLISLVIQVNTLTCHVNTLLLINKYNYIVHKNVYKYLIIFYEFEYMDINWKKTWLEMESDIKF